MNELTGIVNSKYMHQILQIIVLVLSLMLAGCSSIQPIDRNLSPENITETITKGDAVIIHTKNGTKHEMIVESINSKEITGDGVSYLLIDIEEIHKSSIDKSEITSDIPKYIFTGTVVFAVYLYFLFNFAFF